MRCTGLVGLLLAACGGGGGGATPDAAAADGAGDAPIDVAVYTDNYDGAKPNVVYFVAPDGTTQKVALDVYGHAKAVSPANSWVIVAHFESAAVERLDVYGGIGPGMTVSDFTPQPVYAALLPKPTVTVPRYGTATVYILNTSCGGDGSVSDTSAGAIVAIPLQALDCPQKTDANVVATATDADQQLLGYSWLQHADLTQPMTLPAMQAPSTISVTFANLPFAPQPSDASLYLSSGSDPAMLASVHALGAMPTSDSVTLQATVPPVGDRTYVSARIQGTMTTAAYSHTVPGISALTIDGAAIPRLPDHRTFDAATGTISWQEAATGATPQMASWYAQWRGADVQAATMYAYAPYTGTTMVLPPFPSELDVELGGAEVSQEVASVMTLDETYAQVVSEGFATPPAVWEIGF